MPGIQVPYYVPTISPLNNSTRPASTAYVDAARVGLSPYISASAPINFNINPYWFNTNNNILYVYNNLNSTWVPTIASNAAVRQTFSSQLSNLSSGQTVFTITGGYSPNLIDVYQNGYKLVNGSDVDITSGTSIILTSSVSSSDIIDVVGGATLSALSSVNYFTQSQSNALYAPQNNTGFRNRIINGDMRIDQRNSGALQPSLVNDSYTIDRWLHSSNTMTSKFNSQQNASSVTPPSGFSNYLGFTSTSAYTLLSNDYFGCHQRVEGYTISDLAWGTLNAKSVTISFWVYSSLAGSFSISLSNNTSTYSYVAPYTIATANTWTYITLSIPGCTSGVWPTSNYALEVRFQLAAGSQYQTLNTNQWISGNYTGTSSNVSVVGTNGAKFFITGVQLEPGLIATSFESRFYGLELSLCQRYYQVGYTGIYRSAASSNYNGGVTFLNLPITMRVTPSITTAFSAGNYNSGYQTAANTTSLIIWFSIGGTAGDYSDLTYTLSAEL